MIQLYSNFTFDIFQLKFFYSGNSTSWCTNPPQWQMPDIDICSGTNALSLERRTYCGWFT